MPSLRYEGSLAAGTPLANLLSGSKFEMLPFPAAVQVFAVQDGADAGDLKLDLTLGNVVEIDDYAVPTYTADQGPDMDKHRVGGGVAAAHDRVQLRLTNQDAVNASAYRVVVDIRRVVVGR